MDITELDNISLAEINFRSKKRPPLDELAKYIDKLKKDLFKDEWSTSTKKHIKTSLVL